MGAVMAKRVSKMIEEQVQFWALKNSGASLNAGHDKLPVITISREFGAKGAALAEMLGERLGFKVWDKELLDIISKKLGTNQDFTSSLDENRRNMVEDAIFGFMNHKGTNLNYLIYLVRAVHAIERLGNSIIVGRGANYICQNPDTLNVRVVAPIKDRIADYAANNDLTKEQALIIVKQKDTERANFSGYNFNRDITNASDYDLLLNSSVFSIEHMAELVITAYKQKTGKSIRVAEVSI